MRPVFINTMQLEGSLAWAVVGTRGLRYGGFALCSLPFPLTSVLCVILLRSTVYSAITLGVRFSARALSDRGPSSLCVVPVVLVVGAIYDGTPRPVQRTSHTRCAPQYCTPLHGRPTGAGDGGKAIYPLTRFQLSKFHVHK